MTKYFASRPQRRKHVEGPCSLARNFVPGAHSIMSRLKNELHDFLPFNIDSLLTHRAAWFALVVAKNGINDKIRMSDSFTV